MTSRATTEKRSDSTAPLPIGNRAPADRSSLLLLPGLHGTTDLFDPFLSALGGRFTTTVAAYPTSHAEGYAGLPEMALSQCKHDGRAIIVAESFSGPIAVRLAAAAPERFLGVVLVASFVSNPAPRGFTLPTRLVPAALFRIGLPKLLIRLMLTGVSASPELVQGVADTLRSIPAKTLAARLRAVARVDATAECARLQTPVAYIRARQDRLIASRGARRLSECRPDAEMHELAGPHLLLQTRPDECATILEDLAERWARGGE
jgi:pimeloyl-[acyl-carrier protein] methyl ester esterase